MQEEVSSLIIDNARCSFKQKPFLQAVLLNATKISISAIE